MSVSIQDPVMRNDDHFLQKHKSFIEIIKNQAIDVLFLGDSITRRWEDNIDVWNMYFQKYNACNFGIGQDCLQNIKWRILNGEIDNINPKVIILLIGTNNFSTNSNTEIITAIQDILSIIAAKLPKTRIILLGIFPRGEDEKKINYRRRITKINVKLRIMYLFSKIVFYDVGKIVFLKNGEIDYSLLGDGLHPNSEGYKMLGPYIKKIIDKYIS